MTPGQMTPHASPSDSLLVVDDDELNRDMISRRLSRHGYQVSVAENGERALQSIRERAFDLILLDVMMPDLSGLEVLERLRKEYPATDLPIIMATARTQSEDIVEALRRGANDYVTKPFDFPVVLARIQTHMSLKRSVERVHQLEQSLAERNRELESVNSRLVEVNRRMSRDLESAAKVQAALLPGVSPNLPKTVFAWNFRPCDELAGDGLGIVRLGADRVGLYVLDVSGHGVASAMLSVSVSRLLTGPSDPASILVDHESGNQEPALVAPAEVMARLNRFFPFDITTEQYFTISYGILDAATGEFRFVSAGHPGPIYAPARGTPRELNAGGGLPIGLAEDPYEEESLALNPGDRLVFYSDGVPEASSPEGELFGGNRLRAAIDVGRTASLAATVASLRSQVESWTREAGVRDDITILAAEWSGDPAAIEIGATSQRSLRNDQSPRDDEEEN